jgi:hypothetical protein
MSGKPVMPSTRSLLQTIQRFVEPTYKIRARGICKTLGLNAVDYLSESTMQERILHVKLVNGAVLREARERTTRTVAGLTTGLKVSS